MAKIAAYFGLECAPPLPMPLESMMADKAMLWRELVQRHQLTEPDYRAVAGWRFADFVFSWDYDMFADGSKARRFGFHQFVETEAMFSRCSMSSAAVASFPECGIGFPQRRLRERLQNVNMILPMCSLDSISACAAAACSSGKVLKFAASGRRAPAAAKPSRADRRQSALCPRRCASAALNRYGSGVSTAVASD